VCGLLLVCPVVVFHYGLALVLKQGPGHGPIEPWWQKHFTIYSEGL
jgi:hypothetical protein